MKRKTHISTMFAVLAAALVFPMVASATTVTPIFVPGNPTCEDLGYDFGFKIDPPVSGTYSIDGINTITFTTDGVSFDWSSTLGMDAVISKGGPVANVYLYDPPAEATSDTGLHSPVNPNNGQFYGLSHATFCFDYEVEALKKQGLARGGSLDNAVVIGIDRIHNKEKKLRFPDEFARHKALDLLGDLFLLGVRLQGHVKAVRPGHGHNINFVKLLAEKFLTEVPYAANRS